jgi:hypothetical protein
MPRSLKFASDKKLIFIGLKFPITCNFSTSTIKFSIFKFLSYFAY